MTKIDRFEEKVINTINKYDMLKSNDRVLVGLSGGKDSVALLFALSRLAVRFSVSLFAYHLNHGIRGEEADADCLFSKKLCEKLSIPFVSSFVDVPSMHKLGDEGLEAVARDARYSEFKRVAEELDCNKIATAHTASDNTETLFISLARNSNFRGIPPVRDNIIRPLIFHTTDEVLEYCKRHSLSFVTDSTNADSTYTRNYVRNEILPKVYNAFPSFDESVERFSEITRSNNALSQLLAKEHFEKNKAPVSLNALKPLAENEAYYNVLYVVISDFFDIRPSYKQFDDIVSLILNGSTGQRVDVSGNVTLIRGYDELEVYNDNSFEDYSFEIKRGKNFIPNSKMALWLETEEEYRDRIQDFSQKSLKVNKLSKKISIKYNIIKPLIARSRKNGDSFVCRGINRNIKKFMIDEKIPSSIRSRIPIICDDEGVVCVFGIGVADRIEALDDTENYILSLDLEKTDS